MHGRQKRKRHRQPPAKPAAIAAPAPPSANEIARRRERRHGLWLVLPWALIAFCFIGSLHPTFFGIGIALAVFMIVVLIMIRYDWVMSAPLPAGRKQRFRLRAQVTPGRKLAGLLAGALVVNGALAAWGIAGPVKVELLYLPGLLGAGLLIAALRQGWIVLGGGPTTVEISGQPIYSAGATTITVTYAGRRPLRRLRVLLLGSRRARRGGSILHHEVIAEHTPPSGAASGEFTCTLAALPRDTAVNHWVLAVEVDRAGTPVHTVQYDVEPRRTNLA